MNDTQLYGYSTPYAIDNEGDLYVSNGHLVNDSNWTLFNKGFATVVNTAIYRTGNSDNGTGVNNLGNYIMIGGSISSSCYGLANKGSGSASIDGTSITTGYGYECILQGGVWQIVVWNSGLSTGHRAVLSNSTAGVALYNCSITGELSDYVVTVDTGYVGAVIRLYGMSMLGNIRFYTWTEYGGQDDIISEIGVKQTTANGNATMVEVYKSHHNNETGTYITHIYLDGGDYLSQANYVLN